MLYMLLECAHPPQINARRVMATRKKETTTHRQKAQLPKGAIYIAKTTKIHHGILSLKSSKPQKSSKTRSNMV